MYVSFAEPIFGRELPRGDSIHSRAGISFEKKFFEKLKQVIGEKDELTIRHNQWFRYKDYSGEKTCVPDILLFQNKSIIVMEVKQTFVPNAIIKLRDLYCPVVSKAWGIPCRPLVVCRHLTPGGPVAHSRITFAVQSEYPLYQWTGIGPILF